MVATDRKTSRFLCPGCGAWRYRRSEPCPNCALGNAVLVVDSAESIWHAGYRAGIRDMQDDCCLLLLDRLQARFEEREDAETAALALGVEP